ncbi:MAG: transcriptional regulator [Gemmatimonadetes bacterium]|nr:transcriptional regulator [Gemmatimonadota bacterium]
MPVPCCDSDVSWLLLYTKPHTETWADINLRHQGFLTLLPRVGSRTGMRPLFPRYLFVGLPFARSPRPLANTLGVLYVVQCGELPARVPPDVIAQLRARMNEHGIVQIERVPTPDALFATRERERVNALVKLAQAGFRVRSA